MSIRILSLTAAIAALSLAACQQPAADGANDGDTTRAEGGVEATSTDAELTPGDTQLREGLWQTTMTMEGSPPVVTRMCVDEGMNALSASVNAQAANDCSQQIHRTANGMTFTSECRMGEVGGTISTQGELVGDLNSGYTMHATTTTTGAQMAAMNGTHEMTSEVVYEGACPAGWRGGDMEIPGMGQRINVNDLQQRAGATPPAG